MHFIEKLDYLKLQIVSFLLITILVLQPNFPFSIYILIPIFIISLIKKNKLEWTSLFSIILGLFLSENYLQLHTFSHNVWGLNQVISNNIFLKNTTFTNYELILLKLLAIAFYLGLTFILVFFVKRIFKKYDIGLMLLLTVLIFFFYEFIDYSAKVDPRFYLILLVTGLMLAKTAFYIFNYLRFFLNEKVNISDAKYFIIPMWFLNFEIAESPNGLIVSSEDRTKNAQECLRIIVSSICFKALVVVITFAYGYYLTGKSQYVLIGEGEFIEKYVFPKIINWRNESTFGLWVNILYITFAYVFASFYYHGRLMVAIAKFCGFNIPDYINKPWRSNSFADFFSRTMYYYNIIIINLFFYPLLEYSRRLTTNKKVRIVGSLFLALILGGFLTRFLKDIWKFNSFGSHWSLYSLLDQGAIYNVVLAIFVCVSVWFNNHKFENKSFSFKYIFYFVIYSLIMFLNFSRLIGGVDQLGSFYLKIFFINF